MKGIIKGKHALIVIAFLLIIILIWMGGSWLGWPLNTRLLTVLIVLSGGILLLLFRQMKANRGAASLERSIKMQAESQKQSIRPDKKGEIEELERELLAAIESLKKSKLGRGRSGRAALYTLPWYLFIGPPAAGKTTAIINSGLEFSFGSDIKGVGGTRNCDWFFSNSAIILDTAGRYITEDEDKEEWLSFLDILRKNRKKRPINGVVIGMSIADLLSASFDELEWHAKNIRQRIDELIQRLGIRFPVYLVFTKCDLLQGFVESYENLNRAEREQVWGCTLSREQWSSAHPRELFEQEFDLLTKTLDDYRLKRLSLITKPESRGRVYVFPLEFSGIKENISHFIGKLFQPSPYQEAPIFRGFYFTSGTQEGVPIDRVIQAIAKQFDLPAEMISEPEIQKKSYFIKRLFTDVIIPDHNLVAQTSRGSRQRSLISTGIIAASVVCLGAFVVGISQGYIRSRHNLRAVNITASSLSEVNWDSRDSFPENFRILDRYREDLVALERKRGGLPLTGSGMSRAETVRKPGHGLHYRKFFPFIKRYLYQELEDRLTDYRKGSAYPQERIYDYLKAYLLLGAESVRLDEANLDFLKEELFSVLDEDYAQIIPQDSAGEIKPLVEHQVEYFVQNLGEEETPPFENDRLLVQSIRNLLPKPTDIQGVYLNFKGKAGNTLRQSFTLSQILRGQQQDLVSSEFEVPEFFTKAAWEGYVKEEIEAESKNPDRADWVLGQTETQLSPDLREPKKLAEGLRDLYFEEYSRTWWQFLRRIRYARFDNLSSASEALKKLSNVKESPLRLILDGIARETYFEEEKGQKGLDDRLMERMRKKVQKRDKLGVLPPSQTQSGQPQVKLDFGTLHALSPAISPTTGGSEENLKRLDGLLSQYAALNDKLQSIMSEPGVRSKEAASGILNQQQGDLPQALKGIQAALPESGFDVQAREALFEQPIRNVWEAMLKETQNYLNGLWRDKIYEPYAQALAPYYPFDPQAKDAALLSEVVGFFDPKEGIIGKFTAAELAPFINLETWNSNTWSGQGLSITPDAVAALQKVEEIREPLFALGGLKVNFRLQAEDAIRISTSAPFIEQISIKIDGKLYQYRMGLTGRWEEFSWPGTEGSPGASLEIFSRASAYDPKKFDGEWGWFRLLDEAKIEEMSGRDYKISWLFGQPDKNQVKIQFRLQTSSASHPFRDIRDFFRLSLPETLILGVHMNGPEGHD